MHKSVKLELNYNELVLIHGGLGHYYDYLEKIKKKEKINRRRELEKVQRDIEKLVNVVADAKRISG